MHLARLKLRDFRNYARLDTAFPPGFHVVMGDNAQGKTNLLEAIYLMATLRSFRGVGGAQMIRHGAKSYFVGGEVVGQGTHQIKMYWSLRERRLELNGQPVRRLGDYYGTLRAVIFCTEDLHLIKGSGRFRRRYLDLLLAQTQPAYLDLLRRYTRALRSRNALLKARVVDMAAVAGFSRELILAGTEIMHRRRELLPVLAPLIQAAHSRIAREAEALRLEYQPSVKSDFASELAAAAPRERLVRMTVLGPHRDELALLLNDRPAAQYGSEGQKRTLAIALKMAQAAWLAQSHGSPPVLLIDDVMGELDANRRSGLLPLLEQCHEARGQVFMTCTEENWPRELARQLQRWEVRQGAFRPL